MATPDQPEPAATRYDVHYMARVEATLNRVEWKLDAIAGQQRRQSKVSAAILKILNRDGSGGGDLLLDHLANELDREADALQETIDRGQPNQETSPESHTTKGANMASPVLEKMVDSVTKAKGSMASAKVLIEGFKQRLKDNIEEALKNGATAEELVPFSTHAADLDVSSDELAAAVAANP